MTKGSISLNSNPFAASMDGFSIAGSDPMNPSL